MAEAYTAGGRLIVKREMDNGTSFTETWVLEYYNWANDPVQMPTVHCHISSENYTNGVPHKDDRVNDTLGWEDVPEDVQKEFISHSGNIGELFYNFDPRVDNDEE